MIEIERLVLATEPAIPDPSCPTILFSETNHENVVLILGCVAPTLVLPMERAMPEPSQEAPSNTMFNSKSFEVLFRILVSERTKLEAQHRKRCQLQPGPGATGQPSSLSGLAVVSWAGEGVWVGECLGWRVFGLEGVCLDAKDVS